MTQLADNERLVQGLIKEKAEVFNAEGEEEYKVSITSPFFDSPKDYPVIIYLPHDDGVDLKPRQTYEFVLRSAGKVKDDYDGTKPWMWRWRYVRMANGTEQPSQAHAAAAPQTAAQPQKVASAPWDNREASIQRQVAAKAATDLVVNGIMYDEGEGIPASEQWNGWAEHIIAWIEGRG